MLELVAHPDGTVWFGLERLVFAVAAALTDETRLTEPEMVAAEVKTAAFVSAKRLAAADVSQAPIYLAIAAGVIAGGRDAISYVPRPPIIVSKSPSHYAATFAGCGPACWD